MFVKKNSCKNGRILLTLTQGYRENGKVRQKNIETIGYLDELEQLYDDPIAHYKKIARQRTAEEKLRKAPIELTIEQDTTIEQMEVGYKNAGYFVLEKLYHELGIDTFFKRRENRLKIDYNLNAMFRLLVFSRILNPGSKKKAYDKREQFFEQLAPSLESVYRSLDYFDQFNLDLQTWLNQAVKKQYGRSDQVAYYDVTNYYFEIDAEDELRKKGPSKEHRASPLVQMGLLMDHQGLPMAYHLFPGNQSEKLSLTPILNRVREDYGLGRIVVVADKGLNCGDNIARQLAAKNGYLYSQTIRGASKKFKDYVLDAKGYYQTDNNGRCKSRIHPQEITFKTQAGEKKKITIDQKQVVFYSEKYAAKARHDRAKTVEKALKYLNQPASLMQALGYSAASYIKGVQYNQDGEIIQTKQALYLDEEKIKDEERYDGYYAIVTSELDLNDAAIIDLYHGLWKIEETFKISKSDFRTRPVYVSNEAHIEAHFLTCFVSLLLIRLLELRMNQAGLVDPKTNQKKTFSASALVNSLKQYNCTHAAENYYNFHYIDDLIKAIEHVFSLDLSKKYRSRAEIKNILASMKK